MRKAKKTRLRVEIFKSLASNNDLHEAAGLEETGKGGKEGRERRTQGQWWRGNEEKRGGGCSGL